MRSNLCALALACLVPLSSTPIEAQSTDSLRLLENRTIVSAGLIQPLFLRGANLAVTRLGHRFSASYSHGVSLRYTGGLFLRGAERREELTVRSPFSTGGGIGVRFGKRSDARLEAKAHAYVVRSPGGSQVRYVAFSLGPALYRYKQFGESRWTLESSARYWPNVGTWRRSGSFDLRRSDGTSFRHSPHNLGLIVNVAVGVAL